MAKSYFIRKWLEIDLIFGGLFLPQVDFKVWLVFPFYWECLMGEDPE